MIVDALNLSADTVFEGSIIVIGAGAAGIILALELRAWA